MKFDHRVVSAESLGDIVRALIPNQVEQYFVTRTCSLAINLSKDPVEAFEDLH